MDTDSYELDQLEASVKKLEESLANIKDEMAKSEYEAQVYLIKIKHDKLRAMAIVARSRSLFDKIDLLLVKIQLSIEVQNLENYPRRESSTNNVKRSNVQNNKSSPKKIKLTSQKNTEKEKTASRSSSKSNKENQENNNLPKKNPSKTQEKVSEPQVPISTISERLPTENVTVPLPNCSKNIWPVHAKKTIFLNNPPVRDTNVNNNVGYYSSVQAKQILGYDPDMLPKVNSQGNITKSNGSAANSSSLNNQQVSRTRVHHAYNMSITPGYNLSLLPGYVIKQQAAVEQLNGSNVPNKNVGLASSPWTTLIATPCTKENTRSGSGGGFNTTNQLFRDLMSNKDVTVKDEDMRSLCSLDTIVIATNLKNDILELSQEY